MEHKHEHKKTKLLFVTKKRLTSGGLPYQGGLSSGLANSVRFVVNMLNKHEFNAIHEDVVDGNDINRVLHIHRPDICFLEAIWATPAKVVELMGLYPKITFVTRIHSEIPFLSMEGMSIEWLIQYQAIQCLLGFNSERTTKDFSKLIGDCLYLPNYYPTSLERVPGTFKGKELHVGCFGAIRPFKNQLIQAIAAIQYANENKLKLFFHINTERVEGGGNPVLKNLRLLFRYMPQHMLLEHDWLPHDEFIELVKSMDIGMQMSYNETFNIVSADFVNNNIPIITSDEVEFIHPLFVADSNDVEDIKRTLDTALKGRKINLQYLNKRLLKKASKDAEKQWLKVLR